MTTQGDPPPPRDEPLEQQVYNDLHALALGDTNGRLGVIRAALRAVQRETREAVEAEIAADPDRYVGLKKRLLAQVRESVQRETIQQDAAWMTHKKGCPARIWDPPNITTKLGTCTCGLADRLKGVETL